MIELPEALEFLCSLFPQINRNIIKNKMELLISQGKSVEEVVDDLSNKLPNEIERKYEISPPAPSPQFVIPKFIVPDTDSTDVHFLYPTRIGVEVFTDNEKCFFFLFFIYFFFLI